MKRRTFLGSSVLIPIALTTGACGGGGDHDAPPVEPPVVDEFWNEIEVKRIVESIREPVFPDRDFFVTSYGAVPIATVDSLPAFKQAIMACNSAGGGRVVVPAGTYFVKGPITLLSHVNLHLESENTVILFSRDPQDYPTVLTQYEANPCYNYSPFLYARDATNIAVTGKGSFDGQAGSFDPGADTWVAGGQTGVVAGSRSGAWLWWKNENTTNSDDGWLKNSANEAGATKPDGTAPINGETDRRLAWEERVFGANPGYGYELANGRGISRLRTNFVGFWNCQVALIEGVKFFRSPMWVVAPVLCKEVTVRGVYIDSHGANNDGVNPVCCSQVLIENCELNTGDDCIAIKSGRGGDGYNFTSDGNGGPRPSHDIVIRNCQLTDGHGAITLGSEISGGAYNIFAENITLKGSQVYAALRLKTHSGLGGYVRNVYIRNVSMEQGIMNGNSYGGLLIDANYNGFASPAYQTGGLRDYAIENIRASRLSTNGNSCPTAIFINLFRPDLGYTGGAPTVPVRNCVIKGIKLRDSDFGSTTTTINASSETVDPPNSVAVVYNYGTRSGGGETVRHMIPPADTPNLEAPALVNVTVNDVDRSNA